MFAGSLIESGTHVRHSLTEGDIKISPPSESVKEWPLVGKRIFSSWSDAAVNFESWLQKHREQIKGILGSLFSKLAGIGLGVLQFVFAILIAAAFLSNADSAAAAMKRYTNRLAGARGHEMLNLSVSTIRSVAVGVLGIAFIQAVLAGIGLLIAGVPAAGLWALLVLILAIAQLPSLIILGPIAVYVFSAEPTAMAVFFLVWSVAVSMSDMLLKPLLLGRGVEAPMLVILLGAIGGMVVSGIIGLFLGAVILTLGYKLFQLWVEVEEEGQELAE
jgi:predicted PurR-regulated permease PerM